VATLEQPADERPADRSRGTCDEDPHGAERYPRAVLSADDEPRPCAPCRGTGKVMSNLGGSPSQVDCPWCEGTGTFIADHDAQAAKRVDV
jgi:DnaJ-class molecular chaperone